MSDEVILSELQDLNFSEDQAQMVFAILENRPVRRRRTWKENKMFKAEARKDRKFFRKGDAHHEGGHQRPGGRGNRAGISRENLKKISFCRNCGKKGHWAEDCQQPKATSGDSGRVSGFCYLGQGLGQGSGFSGVTVSEWHKVMAAVRATTTQCALGALSFLTLQSRAAILDIGATQDLIGEPALRALSQTLAKAGLQYVEIPTPPGGAPTGIGGAARVKKAVLCSDIARPDAESGELRRSGGKHPTAPQRRPAGAPRSQPGPGHQRGSLQEDRRLQADAQGELRPSHNSACRVGRCAFSSAQGGS